MERVDAKKALDEFFVGCEDAEHVIGTCLMPIDGKSEHVAIARMFIEAYPTGLWPKQLVYRRALEVCSGVEMFVICPPNNPTNPMIATEWDEQYASFMEAADRFGVFLFEVYTPTLRQSAFYINGTRLEVVDRVMTREHFEKIRNNNEPQRADDPDWASRKRRN